MRSMSPCFLLFLIFYGISASKIENIFQEDYSDYNEEIYRKYLNIDLQLKQLAEQSVKKILPYVLEAREHINISATCTSNLFDLITGIRKLKIWSFNFLDSLGKLQSGVQTGNLQMFGEYEECIETSVMKKGKVDFQGQYCSVACKPLLPKVKKLPRIHDRLEGLVNATRNTSDVMKLIVSRAQFFYLADIRLGICMPSGCTKQEISEIIKYSFGDYINTTVNYCLKKGDTYFWTTKRIIIVSMLTFLGMTVVLSTLLDNSLEKWKNNELGLKSRILQCFSLTRNFPKLMNTNPSEKFITCFGGIRVLAIFYIVLGHDYFFQIVFLSANHIMNFEKMLPNFFAQILWNSFPVVDIFFFMSGFVNSYLRILIKQEGKSQPGILKMIAHRLWRIYPAYIATFLLLYLLNNPQAYYYHLQEQSNSNCDRYWWQNIIFINNFFDMQNMCMSHTWYISVDMQIFLLSLFTIPVLLRKPMKGIILHLSIILIANLCSMSWWLVDDIYPATFDTSKLDHKETFNRLEIYYNPATHIGPYFIGILLGYIIATKKDIKIPKMFRLFGWLVASLLYTSMLFMTLKWNSGIPYTQLESAFYGAFHSTVIMLGFSWLVLCCATGYAGLLNYILSLKLWIPLSRLTYVMYLISPLIQGHYASHASFPEDFSNRRFVWTFFADLTISFLLSFVVVLLVESPIITMEKLLFSRNQDGHKKTHEVEKELPSSNIKGNDLHENTKVTTIHL